MLRDFFTSIFGEEEKLPPEYIPWQRDMLLILGYCKNSFNSKLLNKDSSDRARILSKFYILGMFKYYAEKNNLTYGQYRKLFLTAVPKIGFDCDSCSIVFDSRNGLTTFLTELETDREFSLEKGVSVAKLFFEERLWSGIDELEKLMEIWKEKGYIENEN